MCHLDNVPLAGLASHLLSTVPLAVQDDEWVRDGEAAQVVDHNEEQRRG